MGNQTSGVSSTFMDQFADAKDTINRIKAVMDSMSPNSDWVLISPSGSMWTGSQQEIGRVLLQNIDITHLFKDTP